MFDPDVPIGRVEGETEHRGANQDEQHKGGQFGGALQGLTRQVHIQLAFEASQHQSTHCPHGATFGGRRHAQEDGAQHQEDQDQRRHEHKGDLLGQA